MADLPIILARAHYRDLKDARYELAILPWGATEAHNLHLPYGTDIIQSERIAEAAALFAAGRGARLIVLPAVPYGVNTTQLDIPLTINMNPTTQMAVLKDVATSVQGYGIPKLAILNSHGGNDFKQMIRELQTGLKIFLCTVNWWASIDPKPYFDMPGDHAGELETALMMRIAPETVLPLSEAGSGESLKPLIKGFREKWAWSPRPWTRVTRDTGVGDPRKATPEKGERYFADMVEQVGTFFAELAATPVEKLYG